TSVPKHHIKQDYCDVRPKYRCGKKRTSVRVFTVNLESKYLIVFNVPATGLERELLKLFSIYGTILKCEELKDYPKEEFTKVFLLKYEEIQRAKTAKRSLDEHYFYGAVLHVVYAPEFEDISEIREKIKHRRCSVISRIKYLEKESSGSNKKSKVKQYNNKKNFNKVLSSNPDDSTNRPTTSTENSNSSTKLSTSSVNSTTSTNLNDSQIIGPSIPGSLQHNQFNITTKPTIPMFLPVPPPNYQFGGNCPSTNYQPGHFHFQSTNF
uniref:RNA-binding protein 48 n=1 Tax=Ciona savignyi TaxID=51511 RepID=H2YFY5_CIOSA